MDDLTCFSRPLISDDDWEENLSQCRALIIQQSTAEVWATIGNDVESFRDKLAEWMETSSQNPPRAWLAAKTYCDLVHLPGSEAYRACDRKSMRVLLGMMRRACAEHVDGTTSANANKKRKSAPMDDEEEREDWDLFFATVSRHADMLDLEEMSELFVNLGLTLNSSEALAWVETLEDDEKKRVSLLRTLLAETLRTLHTNELTKERTQWLASAVRALTKTHEDYCLAFLQRLAARVEAATQVNRTKLIELILTLSASFKIRERLLRYCSETLIVGDKSSKRIFACELLASLAGAEVDVAVLRNLAERTRDAVPTVRCASLRSICLLASRRPFCLLDDDECLLKSAMVSATRDDKPGVRRWAVKVLTMCPAFQPEILHVCVERCRDMSISVRKAAVEALGCFILRYPNSAGEGFTKGILPLVKDEEKTVSDAALAIAKDVLLGQHPKEVFALLYSVRSELEMDCLGQALRETASRQDFASTFREFTVTISAEAMAHLPNENEANRKVLWGCWLILEKCAEMEKLPKKSLTLQFVLEAWDSCKGMLSTTAGFGVGEEDEKIGMYEAHALQRRILRILSCILSEGDDSSNKDARLVLGNELLQDLAGLDRPPEVQSEMLRVLNTVSSGNEELVRQWGQTLKGMCEGFLVNKFVREQQTTGGSTTESCLFLLGELAMLGFDADNTAQGTRLVPFLQEDELVTLVQALASFDFLKEKKVDLASAALVRALALLTLGKLCVRDDVLAKKCCAIFVKELSEVSLARGGSEAIRINCLLVLGDLCRRFTNLVEPFLDKISKSLGDPRPEVRKRSLLVLASLVQEEYVRLKPTLLYRFIATMADEDPDVRQAGEYVVTHRLHVRYPTVLHSNCSQLVFAMTGEKSTRATTTTAESDRCLVGVQTRHLKSCVNRDHVYRQIFAKLDEAQKLEVLNKMRRDVFGGLLDGTLNLLDFDLNVPEEDALSPLTNLVMDTFRILESEYARAGLFQGAGLTKLSEDGEEVVAPQAMTESSAVQRATAKIIDALERKNLVENVVPLLVSLHAVSARERSSLVKPLVDHLKFLYEKYRAETSLALAPHRELNMLVQIQQKVNGERKPLVLIAAKNDQNETEQPQQEGKHRKQQPKTPKVLRRVKAAMTRG